MARRASLRQLDAEVRGELRNAGIDPRHATVSLHEPLDREHARNSRRYAQVVPQDMQFEFARATLDLDDAHRSALVAHEVGHVIEYRRKGRHSEADADRAAKRELGMPICYDRRWPGKGLQVDCRARNPARRPLPIARIVWDVDEEVVWLASPFPMATKKIPWVQRHETDRAPLEIVRLDELRGTQPDVTQRGVALYTDTPPGCRRGSEDECPVVLRTPKGEMLIQDGHHRLAAAWLRGDETATARVVDTGGAMSNPKRAANPSGYAVLARMNKWQWPVDLEAVTRDESDARVRARGRDVPHYEPLTYTKTKAEAEDFKRAVEDMKIEVFRVSDGTIVYRGSLLGFSDDPAASRLPFLARGRLYDVMRQPESALSKGKGALVVRRANPRRRNAAKGKTTWVCVPGEWLKEGMIVQAPKWVVDFDPDKGRVDPDDPYRGVKVPWKKFWGSKTPPTRLRVLAWTDDGESELVGLNADGSEQKNYVDQNTADYPPVWLVDVDSIDMDESTRRATLRQGVYPPDYDENPVEGFTQAEAGDVFDVAHECARKVADDSPNADVVFENYFDPEKHDPKAVTVRFKFVPRVPTQRHLSLVRNPKVRGFTANTVELLRTEFERCAGRKLESMRLWARYEPAKPSPRGVPIRMTVKQRSAQQSDLFGNPRARTRNPIRVGDHVRLVGTPKWWRKGDPIQYRVDQIRPRAREGYLLDNGRWVGLGMIVDAGAMAHPRRETNKRSKGRNRNATVMVGEIVAIELDENDLAALDADASTVNPRRRRNDDDESEDRERGWSVYRDHRYAVTQDADGYYWAHVEGPMDGQGVNDEWSLDFTSRGEAVTAAKEAIDRWHRKDNGRRRVRNPLPGIRARRIGNRIANGGL